AGHRAWDQVRAECDAGGRFVLDDVMSGRIRPLARRNGQRLPTEPVTVAVPPGGLARITLRPPTPRPQPEPAFGPIGPKPGEKEVEVVWVAGMVVDEARRPQPGAKVYARSASRRNPDERGHPRSGRSGRPLRSPRAFEDMGPLTVVAYTEGKPPAVAYAAPVEARREAADAGCDARRPGGDISVAIVKDGRPVPGAASG
ncbi:MAG: hypothetical protein WKF75_16005, partial [Singulisphaera sp.]